MTEISSIKIRSTHPSKHSNNRISNTKCSLLMVPLKILLMQFENASSIFFLIIILIQLNHKYRITSLYTSFLPWLIIFSVNVLREMRENYCRNLRDKEINQALYKKLVNSDYILVESQNIKAGDIILIEKGQRVPADCVLLKSEELSGEIFIRTDQLDGETDWKRRNSHPETQLCSIKSLMDIEAEIELPNKDIYSFNGKLIIKNFVESREDNNVIFSHSSSTPIKYANSNFETTEISVPNSPMINNNDYETPVETFDNSNIIKTTFIDENRILETKTKNLEEHGPIAIAENENKKEIMSSYAHDENFNIGNQDTIPVNLDSVVNPVNFNEYCKEIQTNQKEMALDLENTIWANTEVSSSAALGLIIYTGNDTRSMMNTLKPITKTGIIERELDRFIMIMASISFISAFFFTISRIKFQITEAWAVIFMRFVIIFSYVIPISLKFMLAIARQIYALKLSYDPTLNTIKVMTNTLQEELARISFFLTDKTGTLTKNEMLMRKLHIGTICYNADSKDEIIKSITKVLDKSSAMKKMFWKKTKSIDTKMYDLVEALSICNNVNPIETESGTSYQASSPDEIAMVNYAVEVGMKMIKRDNHKIVIKNSKSEEVEYKVLYMFPFNSDTKRMGIIIFKDDQYIFFEKGADTVMKNIVKENDWVEEETDNMAREGLRTLVIAKKVISNSEFKIFSKAYEKAKKSLIDRNELMLAEQCSLENNLDIVGLTGVEDKLQDRAKQTLECIRNAGIKIWMLTGDKIETAISIAFSSRLLTKNDHYTIISKCTSKQEIDSHLTKLSIGGYNALVIDGESLSLVIDHYIDRFIDIVKNLHCLIGCRYSPTQKATMALKLREKAKETVLCIGDGGNDVSMITSADVGVGIEGKEGSQASLAADFSLKSFADVADLMFYHGRRCYKNSSKMSHIIFHRGIIISTIQGIFCALIYFYPISILQGMMPFLFIIFTIIPLFWIIFDEDICKGMSLKYPELYRELRENNLLSIRQFFITLTLSVFQASVFILLCYFSINNYEIANTSIVCFSNLIINEQLMVILCVWENLNSTLLILCFFSVGIFLLSTHFISELNTFKEIFKISKWLLLINILAILPKFIITIYNIYINPASHIKLKKKL